LAAERALESTDRATPRQSAANNRSKALTKRMMEQP